MWRSKVNAKSFSPVLTPEKITNLKQRPDFQRAMEKSIQIYIYSFM